MQLFCLNQQRNYHAWCVPHGQIVNGSFFTPIEPTAEVTGNGNSFMIGVSLTLNCIVSGADILASPTESYVWRRDGTIISGVVGFSLMFITLATSDIGSYTCTVTINDTLLSSPISVTSEEYSVCVGMLSCNLEGSPRYIVHALVQQLIYVTLFGLIVHFVIEA